MGTNAKDVFYGKGGNDGLAGRGADDVLYGGDGHDLIYGGYIRFGEMFQGRQLTPDGQDKLFGGKGNDCLFGGTGNDILYGGDGHDMIGLLCFDFVSDFGKDIMYGGRGNDDITALEVERGKQQRDIVFCGPGQDTVYYRKGVDWVSSDCEWKESF